MRCFSPPGQKPPPPGMSRRALAAEERPHRAALLWGGPPDPPSACLYWLGCRSQWTPPPSGSSLPRWQAGGGREGGKSCKRTTTPPFCEPGARPAEEEEEKEEEEKTSSGWHVLTVSCPSPAKQIFPLSVPRLVSLQYRVVRRLVMAPSLFTAPYVPRTPGRIRPSRLPRNSAAARAVHTWKAGHFSFLLYLAVLFGVFARGVQENWNFPCAVPLGFSTLFLRLFQRPFVSGSRLLGVSVACGGRKIGIYCEMASGNVPCHVQCWVRQWIQPIRQYAVFPRGRWTSDPGALFALGF